MYLNWSERRRQTERWQGNPRGGYAARAAGFGEWGQKREERWVRREAGVTEENGHCGEERPRLSEVHLRSFCSH